MSENGSEMKLRISEVKRNEYLISRDAIASHIAEVGRRIIADSDNLAFEPSKCSRITITADINPGNSVTHVEYTVEMIADPRTGGKTE